MNNKAILFGIDYSSSNNLLNEYKSHTNEIYTMKQFLENKFNFKTQSLNSKNMNIRLSKHHI